MGRSHQNHYSFQKTRINDLSYGVKMWAEFSSVLSQSTRLTGGRTAFSWLGRVACYACSSIKIKANDVRAKLV